MKYVLTKNLFQILIPTIQVVVLSMVMVNDLNISYDDFVGGVVEEVNGESIVSLADLAEKVEKIVNDPECTVIEFKTTKNYRLVLPTLHVDDCKKIHEATLARYRVPKEKQILKDLPLHQNHEIQASDPTPTADQIDHVLEDIINDRTLLN